MTKNIATFEEKEITSINGWFILIALLSILGLSIFAFIGKMYIPLWAIIDFLALSLLGGGLFIVKPNEAKVLMFFGHYVGTVRKQGLQYTNPFYNKITVSVRINNFETNHLKVNDNEGNPVEVASIIVWRVIDTAKALFEVESYSTFVSIQSEAALRNLVMQYAYDDYKNPEISLIKNTEEISHKLKLEVQERLFVAGIEVIEARISHLAYAPEIASAMLQRQQAKAIVAARTEIVEGAVGMVEMALQKIENKGIVSFDEQAKTKLVSNLMVVLVSDQNATPVVETNS